MAADILLTSSCDEDMLSDTFFETSLSLSDSERSIVMTFFSVAINWFILPPSSPTSSCVVISSCVFRFPPPASISLISAFTTFVDFMSGLTMALVKIAINTAAMAMAMTEMIIIILDTLFTALRNVVAGVYTIQI